MFVLLGFTNGFKFSVGVKGCFLPQNPNHPQGFASVVKDLKYADSHEWVKDDRNCATVGITDHARNHLGDVHVELPEVGAAVKQPRLWSSRKCQGNQ